ncbi:hypothetical protein IF1G_09742 [Cordyceps javanica]|uniref:Uncharacterized protein n=1 Tax=Cordyceps javanica TaxID=43265 RepID=A0A545VPD7_9HYPO|nr:hypothetical protein IF1G_09742 [Cordyceps javanica]TQW03546.1 hypothetical protein IF2G_08844 [Cordyceps javanica]
MMGRAGRKMELMHPGIAKRTKSKTCRNRLGDDGGDDYGCAFFRFRRESTSPPFARLWPLPRSVSMMMARINETAGSGPAALDGWCPSCDTAWAPCG